MKEPDQRLIRDRKVKGIDSVQVDLFEVKNPDYFLFVTGKIEQAINGDRLVWRLK